MTDKVSLLEMILYAESELERVTIWDSELIAEGGKLPDDIAKRRLVAQRIVDTLVMVKTHEHDIVALIKKKKQEARKVSG